MARNADDKAIRLPIVDLFTNFAPLGCLCLGIDDAKGPCAGRQNIAERNSDANSTVIESENNPCLLHLHGAFTRGGNFTEPRLFGYHA